jgi:acyl-CoA thioesterase
MDLSKKVVNKMISGDAFSQWLGIKIIKINEGNCTLEMTVRDEMTNGFHIAHGGIAYSLADSALAFAANSYGIQAMSIETSISHTKKVKSGDVLKATTKEINKSNKTAIYYITITNQNDIEVAHFKGTVFVL